MKPVTFANQKKLTALLGSALLLSSLPVPLTATTDPADELQKLRQQTEALAQKVSQLEQQQAAAAKSAQSAAADAGAGGGATVSANSGGFTIASADKDYAFTFRGLAQLDNRQFFSSSIPSDQNRFVLRRLRPIFQGRLAGIYEFSFVPELASGNGTSSTVGLVDAWFSARPYKAFGVKLGKFTSPAALEPGSNAHFIESPYVNNLLPNRDIGIEAFGTVFDDVLSYRAGVFAGVRNNTSAFNVETNGGDKSFAGRLTLAPFAADKDPHLSAIQLSLGTRVGYSSGDNTNGGLQNYVTNGQQTLLNWGNLSAAGNQYQLNPAIEWYPKAPYSVVAEFALQHQELQSPVNGKFDITNTAWRVTAGYVLTGEARSKSGVKPERPFDWGGGNWGAFEVVARLNGTSLDNKLFDPSLGGLSTATNASGAFAYGAGINWYLNDNVRVLLNVEQTNFTGATARSDELYVFTRFQLSF